MVKAGVTKQSKIDSTVCATVYAFAAKGVFVAVGSSTSCGKSLTRPLDLKAQS